MITHILASIALITGTVTDFKRREVPNFITLGLIVAAALIAITTSIHQLSFNPLLYSALGAAIAWLIGATMHYTGQWGGADLKLLVGLGALFGIQLPLTPIPFFLLFLLVGVFAGAIYGILYLAIILIKNYSAIHEEINKTRTQNNKKIRLAAITTILALFIIALLHPTITTIILVFLAATSYFTYTLYYLTQAIEKHCFIKQINVNKLVPGDWLAEDVKHNNKALLKVGQLTTGLEEKHIQQLKKHKIKTVTVKEGIPFIPSFLLAYIATLLLQEPIREYLSLIIG